MVCGQGYTQRLHISLSVRQECSCVFLLESHCCCHHMVLGPERGRTLLHLTPPHSQHTLPTHSCAKVFIAPSHSTLPSHSPPYSCCSLATVDCGMHCAQVLIPEWRWSSNVVAPITSWSPWFRGWASLCSLACTHNQKWVHGAQRGSYRQLTLVSMSTFTWQQQGAPPPD